MAGLINILNEDKEELLVNPADITAICHYAAQDLLLIKSRDGVLAQLSTQFNKVDPHDVAQKLAAAGKRLSYCPSRDCGKEFAFYIDPAEVAYMTQSVTSEGSTAVIVAIPGLRHEAYMLTDDEATDFVQDVLNAKKMLIYTPDVAHARWSFAKALYIDPAAVEKISCYGGAQVDVFFKNAGRLDVQVWNINPFEPFKREYLPDDYKGDLSDIFNFERKWREDGAVKTKTLREGIVKDIATHNSQLIRIPTDEESTVLISKDAIGYVRTGSAHGTYNIYILGHPENGQPAGISDALSLYYKTEQERDAVMATVFGAKARSNTGPKPA